MIAEFHWKAINRFGQKQRGKCLAKSRDILEKTLLENGYSRLKISRNFVFATEPKYEQITQLLNQVALLLNASIPFKVVLTMVLESCQNIRLYQWIEEITDKINKGISFSRALTESGKYLQTQEIQLIQMGETSGQLALMLKNLVNSREKTEKLQKKLKKVLFYPIIVLAISLSVALALLLFIVPQFAELYSAKEKQLPVITNILFYLSSFLANNITYIFFMLIIGIVIGYVINRKTAFFRQLILRCFTYFPFWRIILRYSRIVFFCQNCALMLYAHIPIDRILATFLQKNSDPILAKEAKFSLALLEKGYRLYEGLNPMLFGTETIQMVKVGEQSGNLAEMLSYISDLYQQRLDERIDLLSQLLEPMLMIFMGVIVSVILIGLYLPMFDIGAVIE